MTTPVSQAREESVRLLVERIVAEAQEKIPREEEKTSLLGLAAALLQYLSARRRDIQVPHAVGRNYPELVRKFFEYILEQVESFSRDLNDEDAIIIEIHNELVTLATLRLRESPPVFLESVDPGDENGR